MHKDAPLDVAGASAPREFEKFRRLAYDKFGLNLTAAKQELVAARLGKKLRELKIPSYPRLLRSRAGGPHRRIADRADRRPLHQSHLLPAGASHFDFLIASVLPSLRTARLHRYLERALLHRRRALFHRRHAAGTSRHAAQTCAAHPRHGYLHQGAGRREKRRLCSGAAQCPGRAADQEILHANRSRIVSNFPPKSAA